MIYVLTLLGCLGVFLFGMKVLSEGVQIVAGDGMRRLMANMTRNRLAGVFTGFVATGILQSSSATTVIVVSFVNAGLLTLIESIGVIMGANLGTTVTAWIIAAVGKFSLADWALPIIGVGLPCLFVGKGRVKGFGQVCIGFGLLFYGLDLLKDSVPDVKSLLASSDPEVQKQAQSWKDFIDRISGKGHLSLLAFLAGGILLTVVVQSSSAAMAITITLALKGWIGFEESCAIVLGENIGTTITAYLASLGASTDARRAARAHFIFNVIGTLWMLVVFFWFTAVIQWLGSQLPDSMKVGKFAEEGDLGLIAWNLALFHTLFNLTNIAVLIGFAPRIAHVVSRWVKDVGPSRERHMAFIPQPLSGTADVNLPEAEKGLQVLSDGVTDMMNRFEDSVLTAAPGDLPGQLETLRAMEEDSDTMLHELTEYLVRCSTQELSPAGASEVGRILRVTTHLEEIADCLYRAAVLVQRRHRGEQPLAEEMTSRLKEMTVHIRGFLTETSRSVLSSGSDEALIRGKAMERKGAEMRRGINELSLQHMQGGGDRQRELANMGVARELEKIGNYTLNIIEAVHE